MIDDPHPYPSPLEGEGQRERGLYIGGALEKDVVIGKRAARPDLQQIPEQVPGPFEAERLIYERLSSRSQRITYLLAVTIQTA